MRLTPRLLRLCAAAALLGLTTLSTACSDAMGPASAPRANPVSAMAMQPLLGKSPAGSTTTSGTSTGTTTSTSGTSTSTTTGTNSGGSKGPGGTETSSGYNVTAF